MFMQTMGEPGVDIVGVVGTTADGLADENQGTYRVYKRRWFILGIVCMLNISNAALWLSYAPVTNYSAAFYAVKEDEINLLSIVYMAGTLLVGGLAVWIIDAFGLRTGMLIGAWLNAFGAAVRVVSGQSFISADYRFAVVMTGQTLCAISQPFIMFLPTKLAATWFAENQRAVANTIASMSNPLGILLANALSPLMVAQIKDINFMNEMYFIPAGVAVAMTTAGMCSSGPPTPPSSSAADESETFFVGFKKLMRTRAFLVLFVALGGGIGLFTALTTLLQQIVCPRGYSNEFAGICAVLLIVFGIIGSVIAGVVVDATKKFEEVVKVSFAVASLSAVFFAIISRERGQEIAIGAACALFGMAGFAVYPIGLELGVEATYPIAEATSSGILIMSGQIQGILYLVVMTLLQRDLSTYDSQFQVCTLDIHGDSGSSSTNATTVAPVQVDPHDMTTSTLFFAGCCSMVTCFFILVFHTEYKRLKAEREAKAKQILDFSVNKTASKQVLVS